MWQDARDQMRIALVFLLIMILLTGLAYPVVITGLAQLCFPWKANGSLIVHHDKTIGSVLIGQSFTDPHYFWSRPSATTPFPYNGVNSSGSNLGPSNPDYLAAVKERVKVVHQFESIEPNPVHGISGDFKANRFRGIPVEFKANRLRGIPVDLVTASGSGLDPDISLSAALYQVPRIAKMRQLEEKELYALIANHHYHRWLGFLGEPCVNVLLLNIALDNRQSTHEKST